MNTKDGEGNEGEREDQRWGNMNGREEEGN